MWTSDLNGSNARLVTKHAEVILNPRWSPDGRSIAFSGLAAEGNAGMRSRVYIVPTGGGTPQRLLPRLNDVSFSNWSRNGKWLYVSRGNLDLQSHTEPQLWKLNATGGQLAQITKSGGFAVEESADGEYLYYTTSPYPRLHRVPVSGGTESTLLDTGLNAAFGAFAVGKSSIFFAPEDSRDQKTRILKFDLASGAVDTVVATDFVAVTLQLGPDERYLFARSDPPAKRSRVILDGLR